MTATSDGAPRSTPTGHDLVLDLPPSGSGERARRRRRQERLRRWRRVAFGISIGLLAASVPVLVFVGFREVANSRSGRQVDVTKEPTQPGYEAVVVRTPVALVAQVGPVDEEGATGLVSLTVFALGPGEEGGAVLFVPVATEVEAEGRTAPLSDAYEADGLDGVRVAAASLLRTDFDEVVEADGELLARLVAPVAPLEIDNPDEVATGEVGFEAGSLPLADNLAEYLAARGEQESDLARLVRHEIVWSAWLDAIAASQDPAVVPGETTSGVGRFLRGLAAGPRRFETLPVEVVAQEDGTETFRADEDSVAGLLADLIPFPTSPAPGVRPRVRVLKGVVGADAARDRALRALVEAGAEIETVGNAESFDHRETSVTYYDEDDGDLAEAFRDALGVGTVTFDEVGAEIAEMTVILGADYLEEETTG